MSEARKLAAARGALLELNCDTGNGDYSSREHLIAQHLVVVDEQVVDSSDPDGRRMVGVPRVRVADAEGNPRFEPSLVTGKLVPVPVTKLIRELLASKEHRRTIAWTDRAV